MKKTEGTSTHFFPVLLAIGGMAFVIAFLHGNPPNTVPITFAYDSLFYRETTSIVMDVFQQAGNFQQHRTTDVEALIKAVFTLPLHMRHDGPILPIVFASIGTFFNQPFTVTNWPFVVEIESAIYAVTVVLVGILAHRLTADSKSAIAASCIYALYPSAILATGRLLTETPANLIICVFLLVLTANPVREHRALPLVAGILTGVLLLLKAALISSLGLALVFYLFVRRRKILAFVFLPAGVGLMLACWYLLSGKILHYATLLPDRGGAMNLALGLDPETGGVPTIFAGQFVKLCFDLAQPLQSASGLVINQPWQFVQLLLWKLDMMLVWPWTDFLHPCLGLNLTGQLIVHALTLSASLFGLIMLCTKLPQYSRNRDAIPFIYIGFFLGHVIWLLFATCARYFFSATPLVAIFAALPLMALQWLDRKKLLVCTIAWLVIASALGITHSQSAYNLNEQSIALWNGTTLSRQFDLPADKRPEGLSTALLIIDADGITTDTAITVNGTTLPGAPVPLYEFDDGEYSFLAKDEMSTAALRTNKTKTENSRLWRAIVVPTDLIHFGQTNTIEIKQNAGKAIVFASGANEVHLPDFLKFSDELFYLNPARGDGRPRSLTATARRLPGEKWFLKKPGVQPGDALEIPNTPRVKLMFVGLAPSSGPSVPVTPAPSRTKVILRQVAAADIDMYKTQVIRVDAHHLEMDVVVPMNHLRGGAIYELSGLARSLQPGKGGISHPSLSLLLKGKHDYLAMCPLERQVTCTKQWTPFRITGAVRLPNNEELTSALLILQTTDLNRLRPGEPLHTEGTEFWNMAVKTTPIKIPKCDFRRMAIY